jgi:flavodoxin short chain
MSKIIVAYWSQTGNTEVMAKEIGKGIEEAGKEAEVLQISKVVMEDLKVADCFALGCPAMGGEVLEEDEMEPFVNAVEEFAAGKKIALFGSYGWGDGQWMRDWEERMIGAGAQIINGEGLIAEYAPDDSSLEDCKKLGKELATV